LEWSWPTVVRPKIVPENANLPDSEEQRNRRKTDAREEGKVTVLAVDDDLSYLRYLDHLLRRAGYAVLTAPSPHGSPRLADDHRMRNIARVAHACDAVDDVACVLIQRVVHRR